MKLNVKLASVFLLGAIYILGIATIINPTVKASHVAYQASENDYHLALLSNKLISLSSEVDKTVRSQNYNSPVAKIVDSNAIHIKSVLCEIDPSIGAYLLYSDQTQYLLKRKKTKILHPFHSFW